MNKHERAERLKEMRRLYENEKWTLEQIGKHFGVTRQAVHDRFKRAGIKCRTYIPQKPKRILDRDNLVRLYVDEKRQLGEIIRFFKTNHKKLNDELDRYGIEKRSRGYSNRKYPQLYEMKVGEVIQIKRPAVKKPFRNLHIKAYAKGIRISIRDIGNDTFQITRVE